MQADGLKQAIIRSCTDLAFRRRLLTEPRAALLEAGVEIPPDIEIRVYESVENCLRLVLPSAPDAALLGAVNRTDGPVADSPPSLKLAWSGRTLSAEGRIDAESAPVLKRELCNARSDVDMDMSKTTFLSSAGISALLAGMTKLRESGAHLRLLDVPEPIANVLAIAGFSDVFEMAAKEKIGAELYGALADASGMPVPIAGMGPPCS